MISASVFDSRSQLSTQQEFTPVLLYDMPSPKSSKTELTLLNQSSLLAKGYPFMITAFSTSIMLALPLGEA